MKKACSIGAYSVWANNYSPMQMPVQTIPSPRQIGNRRSIRLPHYDYSQAGAYFVTICCKNRAPVFGEVVGGNMVLNRCGEIARECWLQIPRHFPNAGAREFVVMPNHVHGIVVLDNGGGAVTQNAVPVVGANNSSSLRPTPTQQTPQQTGQRPRGTSRTIGSIVRGFKIGVTKQIGTSIWQRNYYEHIIRTEADYWRIAQYIDNNPVQWERDRFYQMEPNQ
jgi:REP element-mobilizing transposase RayT